MQLVVRHPEPHCSAAEAFVAERASVRPPYYSWLKDFIEISQERLQRDTILDATKEEIQELKRVPD